MELVKATTTPRDTGEGHGPGTQRLPEDQNKKAQAVEILELLRMEGEMNQKSFSERMDIPESPWGGS